MGNLILEIKVYKLAEPIAIKRDKTRVVGTPDEGEIRKDGEYLTSLCTNEILITFTSKKIL
jgi:hypothetical protein